ncbi:helix-turn-helix transcriptional regulator [Microvirga rosea]|uniref:helix-turn-helix transcriptional regulator n=1 Tax=Microvirga rosea TaxID=2715425 RepID=UPI001D0B054D|nr:YafY family protein [Microvirga rosea]MCB8820654.1 YafY family transcriptional regulator [Microvirga rosea]
MRKASRLFEIIQILRVAEQPVTAAQIAEKLGVTSRSIYRDIAALQAMGVPVQGGRGIGYLLRPGFDLPPLMFSIEETEAIVLALALLERTGDTGLKQSAKRASQRLAAAMPQPLRQALSGNALFAWGAVTPPPAGIDLGMVRAAIRDERKIEIAYRDEQGRETHRTIRPIALIYYSEAANVVAWCELREGLRNFRADRVKVSRLSDTFFKGEGEALRRAWMAGWATSQPASTP